MYMLENTKFERFDLAQLVGLIVCFGILDLTSRPIGYFLCPFAFLLCVYLISPSAFTHRWQRVCTMAAVISVAGFLLAHYFFH